MTFPVAAIVTTSINEGQFLDHYITHICDAGMADNVSLIVIPDRKTSVSLFERAMRLGSKGVRILCPTLEEQETFLKRLGLPSSFIPYDSDNRRNVGFLMALELGCEFMISIDDDNYCKEGREFIHEHSVVCTPSWQGPAVHSSIGWYNVCEMLELDQRGVVVYPRGFPYGQRHKQPELITHTEQGPVRLNAGLWLRDPDLDAATWLIAPVHSTSLKSQTVLLGQDTWSPINTQNTALHRDVIVAYYFVRMGYLIAGLAIDRYGDIFSGYFCQSCVRHLGHRIRVGTPLVDHVRNSHNYLRDLTQELACMWITEDLISWLREINLSGSTYSEVYLSLAAQLEDAVERFSGFIWTDTTRGYFHQIAHYMRQWVSACARVS